MNIRRNTFGNNNGFTLLELLVVLLIISLVVGLIPPLFSAALPGTRLKGAARDLASDLRETRNQAITHNRVMDVLLNPETAQYQINNRNHRLPEGVTLGIKSGSSENGQYPAEHRLRFYPDGSATAARITLSRNGQGYELTLDWLIGRIRIAEINDDAR